MSSKSYKKSPTKDQVMSHNVNKKRPTEDENFAKKVNEKKFQKEDEKQKKKKINWEEEKEIIKKYLSERYPLSEQKIDAIIEDKAEKFIDMDKYKSFFLRHQAKNFTEKIKKSKKLSSAPDEVKQFFDQEASETKEYYSSSEEEDDDNVDNDSESEKSNSDEELPEMEKNTSSTRKRKCEFSTLDETSSKKKDTSVLRWLPNGDKFYGKDQDFKKMMDKIKGSGDDVKTINMLNSKMSKQITPLKILLDDDSEIRATNFHGTTKTGRTYISPQIVFVRATGRQRSIDISFPIHQLQQIIDGLQRIKNENDEYFDEL